MSIGRLDGESERYATVRDQLQQAEVALRDQRETVTVASGWGRDPSSVPVMALQSMSIEPWTTEQLWRWLRHVYG